MSGRDRVLDGILHHDGENSNMGGGVSRTGEIDVYGKKCLQRLQHVRGVALGGKVDTHEESDADSVTARWLQFRYWTLVGTASDDEWSAKENRRRDAENIAFVCHRKDDSIFLAVVDMWCWARGLHRSSLASKGGSPDDK